MTAATALCTLHPENCQVDGFPIVFLAVALVTCILLAIWMVARPAGHRRRDGVWHSNLEPDDPRRANPEIGD